MEWVLLDAAGCRRSPATMPGDPRRSIAAKQGSALANPPSVEEIVAVTRATGDGAEGTRLRALIILLWRVSGAILVRRGKGGRRREVGMDRWAWEQAASLLESGQALRSGALLSVFHGPTCGRPWSAAAARASYDAWQRPLTFVAASRRISHATAMPSR